MKIKKKKYMSNAEIKESEKKKGKKTLLTDFGR